MASSGDFELGLSLGRNEEATRIPVASLRYAFPRVAYSGPAIVMVVECESIWSSYVHMPGWELQSVVAGNVMTMSSLPSGYTSMVHVQLLPWTFLCAFSMSPSSMVKAWSRMRA